MPRNERRWQPANDAVVVNDDVDLFRRCLGETNLSPVVAPLVLSETDVDVVELQSLVQFKDTSKSE